MSVTRWRLIQSLGRLRHRHKEVSACVRANWSIGLTGAGKGLIMLLSPGSKGILINFSQYSALLGKLVVRNVMEC